MKLFKKREINKDVSISLDIICQQYESILANQNVILEKLDALLGGIEKETGAILPRAKLLNSQKSK